MLSGAQEERLVGMFYGSEVSVALSLQTWRPAGLRAVLNGQDGMDKAEAASVELSSQPNFLGLDYLLSQSFLTPSMCLTGQGFFKRLELGEGKKDTGR